MQKTKWFFALILTMLLVALPAAQVAASSQVTQMGVKDLDIILVIDESTTMWAYSDTEGWRINMAELFADMLSVDQSGAVHQLTAVMFGTDAVLVSPLDFVDGEGAAGGLKLSIRNYHDDMQATNFIDALNTSYGELGQRGRDGAQKAIIFLTDGHCELQGRGEEGTRQCERDVRSLVSSNSERARIYTIAYGQNASKQDPNYTIYKSLLEEVASSTNAKYFESPTTNEGLLKVYMAIIQDLMGVAPQPVPDAVRVQPGRDNDFPFTIPNGVDQAIFTVYKYNPGIDTRIIDPNDQDISRDPSVKSAQSERSDVFSISAPQAGNWVVRLNGDGKVTVMYIDFKSDKYTTNLLLPKQAQAAGKPMTILVNVNDNGGNPIQVDGLKAVYSIDGQQAGELSFAPYDNNTYRAVLQDTRSKGNYTFKFTSAAVGGDGPQVEDEEQIIVVNAPWLRIVQPAEGQVYPANVPLDVQVQLMYLDQPQQSLDQQTDIVIKADLLDDQNQTVGSQQLQPGPNGIFSAGYEIGRELSGRMFAQMIFTKNNGETFMDSAEMPFVIQGMAEVATTAAPPTSMPQADTPTPVVAPTDVPTDVQPVKPVETPEPEPKDPLPWGPIVGGGLGGLLLLGGGGFAAWKFSTMPALTGMMDVAGATIPLSGKGDMYIGSDAKSAVWLSDADVLPRHARLHPTGSRQNPQVELISMDPNNPALVNDMPVNSKVLENGDRIQIGSQTIQYSGPPQVDGFDSNGNFGSSSGFDNQF